MIWKSGVFLIALHHVTLGNDISFPLAGLYAVKSKAPSVANATIYLSVKEQANSTVTIRGRWIGEHQGKREFKGHGVNNASWRMFGGTQCPGEPPGTQCGYTISCPVPPGHEWPTSCLSPDPEHGCDNVTSGGVSQCRWSSLADAKSFCASWDTCLAFTCEESWTTDPSGCGDCPQPAGSWCKCTHNYACYARGNGTHVGGGSCGDLVQTAFVKTGTVSGKMKITSWPTPTTSGGTPPPSDENFLAAQGLNATRFIFEFSTGELTWKSKQLPTLQHRPNYVPPMPTCAELGCHNASKRFRCNCDPSCNIRGNCCADYLSHCVHPTPGTTCNGGPFSANLPLSECTALQDFFDATDGEKWHVCGGKGESSFRADPCGCDFGSPNGACSGNAGGVCCHDGHVTQIYLGNNNLGGTLPPGGLSALTKLTWINLACNHIGGKIPRNFLEWPRWPSGDPRSEQCQLSDIQDCRDVWHVPYNNWTCPVPKEAADRCVKAYMHVSITAKHPIYKDNYGRLNMIGRERANRALIGCDSQ